MSPERQSRQRGLRGIARSVFRRGVQVSGILWKHGFGPHLRSFGLGRFLPRSAEGQVEPAAAGSDLPVRLRLACEEIGPVTVKLAQVLGSRPDLIPIEYAQEFRKLQDNVPPFSWDQARKVIESDLGAPVGQLFASIEQQPSASASVAQVHKAKLPDGRAVAVKVQRPEAQRVVDTDLLILAFAAREAERHIRGMKDYHLTDHVEEFARTLRAELDFTNEGHNTDRMRQSLSDDRHVVVPRVHWDHTSRRVLTMDWLDGVRADDVEAIEKAGISRGSVAAHLAQSMLHQIFVRGYFHADPHPGNLLVLSDGRLAFLDYGNVGSVDRSMRETLVKLLLAVLEDDGIEVYDQIIDMGVVGEDTDLRQLRNDVQRMMGHYAGVSTSQLSMGDVLEEMMVIVFRHRITMPPAFASVLRSLIMTEGTCRRLSPGFDFREPAERVSREVLQNWFQPGNLIRGIWRSFRDIQRYSLLIPRQVSELLAQFQVGGVTVKIEAEERDQILRRADAMANRLAFSLVVSAMIVGSSVMLSSERATSLLSTPGAVAYVVIGALLGLYLLISIIRSGGR